MKHSTPTRRRGHARTDAARPASISRAIPAGPAWYTAGVNRATRIFLQALVCSLAMLVTAWWIRPGIDGAGVMLGMIRFILIIAGVAGAVVVWASAVFAAAHHVIWPLVVALVTLTGSVVAFVLS